MLKKQKENKRKIENEGEKPVIVLGNPDWRPALWVSPQTLSLKNIIDLFLWGRENGEFIKGSCRSDGTTDLVALMERAKDHFIELGGHKLSGGFSVLFEKIHTLENALIEASTHIVNKNPEILVDAELNLKDVSENFISEILKLAPFGVGNEKPVFIFRDILPEK